MFKAVSRLFSARKPPTQRQLQFAELCGVKVTKKMDRRSVSDAIDRAFRADPKLNSKIAARRKKRVRLEDEMLASLPSDMRKEVRKYNNGADSEYPFYLVVYEFGRKTIVDILKCEGVRLDIGKRNVFVDFYIPRVHDVVAGWVGKSAVHETELIWDKPISIPLKAIRDSRKVKIEEWQTKKYTSQIGRKIAQLNGKRK